MIKINERIAITEDELKFTASKSSGPGGQHVNKTSTRVTLWFDVANSQSLTQEDKEQIMDRLGNRINKAGILLVSSQGSRSQSANRELAVERFAELVREALEKVPARKKTRVSRAAKLRRLEAKRRHGALKRKRSGQIPIVD